MIISKYDLHFPHLSGNVGKLAVTHTLRGFALVLVGVFLPIFLLTKGLELYEVFIFEALIFALNAVIIIPAYQLNARYGIKPTMSASFIFTFLAYAALFFFDQLVFRYGLNFTLLFVAVMGSVGDVGYWCGFHVDFALKSELRHTAGQLGVIEALSISLRALAPVLGAFFVTKFSFNASFLIVMLILAVSIIPLLLSNNVKIKQRLRAGKALSLAHIKLILIFIVEGFNNMAQVFMWPLLLFITSFSLLSIGSLLSVATILTSIVSFWSGKFTDKYSMNSVFKFGAVINGFTLFVRPFFETLSGVFMIQSLGGMSSPLFSLPLMATTYQKARNEGVEILITRDVYLNVGRIIFLFVSIALVVLWGNILGLIMALAVGGVTTIMVGFLSRFFKEHI